MKEFKIILDLVQQAKNDPIYLKNDDLDSVKFIFRIEHDEEIYDLTSSTSVRLAIKKPNNVAVFQECSVTDAANGICEVVLSPHAYDITGLNLGEVYINEGGQLLVTRQFEYKSLGSILAQETVDEGTGGTSGPVYWTDVLNKPTTFPPTSHTHDFVSITGKPATYPPDAHTHDFASLTGKPTSYPPSAHTHAIEDVTGLTESLASKLEAIPAEYLTQTEGDERYAPIGATGGIEPPRTGTVDPSGAPDYIGQTYVNTTTGEAWVATTVTGGWQTISMDELGGGDSSVSWGAVTDKPTAFPPEAHAHVWADITDAPTKMTPTVHNHFWADITDPPATYAPSAHTHDFATEITNKPIAYPAEAHTHVWADITDKPTVFTPETHSHTIGEVTNLEATLNDLDKKPIRGTGAPTVIPEYVAQMYLDQSTGDAYIANGLTSADWRLITNQQGSESVAWGQITGTIATQTDLQEALNSKADDGHTHLWADVTDKPTEFTPVAHTHAIADVTNLETTLGGKADKATTGAGAPTIAPTFVGQIYLDTTNEIAYISDGLTTADWQTISNDEVDWAEITGKPLSFPPDAHRHDWTEIDNTPATYAPSAHTHDWTTGITGKPTAYPPESHTHSYTALTDVPTAFTPTAHTHTEADITFGTKNAKTYVDDADNYILNTVLAGLKLWSGTQLEYDNITTKDPDTLYFIVG